MEYYLESETEAMELTWGFDNITILADFDTPVHDIQIEENLKENLDKITIELRLVTISEDKKKKNRYGPEQIRRFIEVCRKKGCQLLYLQKMHDFTQYDI